MADKMLITTKLASGEVVMVPVVDLDGSAVLEPRTAVTEPHALTDALQSVNAFATRLRITLDAAAPDKATVGFSIGFAMKEGKITAVVAASESDAAITVAMEWNRDPTPPKESPASHGR